MAAPFASLEQRVTSAVFKRLANADALLGGVAVSGIFDAGYALGDVGPIGMSGVQPVFSLPSVSVPADPVGAILTIGARSYTVAVHEADGAGMSRLVLELA